MGYRPNNVSTAPTHWWKLNENSVSDPRADSVSTNPVSLATCVNGSPASLHAASDVGVSGLETYCLELGIVGAWNESVIYSTGHASLAIGTGDFSFSGWIKFEGAVSGSIFATGVGNGGTCISIFHTGGNLSLKIAGDLRTWSWVPSTRVWYHLVIKRSGTTLTAYVNASSLGGSNTSSGNATDSTAKIGYEGYWSVIPGYYQDFSLWKGYAISDAEISALYTNTAPTAIKGIVGVAKASIQKICGVTISSVNKVAGLA